MGEDSKQDGGQASRQEPTVSPVARPLQKSSWWRQYLNRTSVYGFELFMSTFGLVTTAIIVDYGLFALFNYLKGTNQNYVSMAANEFSLWIIAAVLVWLPIAAVFYLRVRGQLDGDGGRRTTTAHKVIVSLYLFINIVLAAGALFAALYSLIRLAVGFDGLGVSDLLVRVVVPALCMVLVHVWMMTAYSPSRRISRKIFTGSILALSLLVTISLLAVSITTIRGQASDTKKEADLEVLRSEVNQYYSAHQTLPNDLDQLDIAQGQLKNKRSTYTYKVQSNRTYQLCADFARETADANLDYKTSTSSSSSRDMYATYANFSQHPKGTHCFSLSAGYGYYDPMPVLPMSDTSKSDTNL